MTDIIDTREAATDTESAVASTGRPVNADGTTDWAVIFDDPDRGIITAVRATQSPKQLAAVLSNVATLLFRRQRDSDPRADFQNTVVDILKRYGLDDFTYARGEIVRMLEKEKWRRIRKAEQYARNKRLSQGIERRKETISAIPVWRRTPGLIAGAVVILLVIVAVANVGLFSNDGPDDAQTAQQKTNNTASQPADARQSPPPKAAAPSGPTPVTVPSLVLKPTPVTVLVDGRSRALLVVPVVELSDRDEWEPLCALAPRIAEGIAFALHTSQTDGRPIDQLELRRAAGGIWRGLADHPATDMAAGPLTLHVSGDLPSRAVAAARNNCARVDLAK